MRDVVADATRALSVQPGEVVEAVQRLQAESRDARRQARALTESLVKYEAAELASAAEEIAGLRVVIRVVDRDVTGLKFLAQAAAALGPSVVLVSESRPALVVASRGTVGAFDAKALVGSLIARFGGKGGGRPELAQAGGLHGNPAEIGAASAEILKGG